MEKKAFYNSINNWNVKICVNDTDKNLGPISSDKSFVIYECHRQLQFVNSIKKYRMHVEAKKLFVTSKLELQAKVRKHL